MDVPTPTESALPEDEFADAVFFRHSPREIFHGDSEASSMSHSVGDPDLEHRQESHQQNHGEGIDSIRIQKSLKDQQSGEIHIHRKDYSSALERTPTQEHFPNLQTERPSDHENPKTFMHQINHLTSPKLRSYSDDEFSTVHNRIKMLQVSLAKRTAEVLAQSMQKDEEIYSLEVKLEAERNRRAALEIEEKRILARVRQLESQTLFHEEQMQLKDLELLALKEHVKRQDLVIERNKKELFELRELNMDSFDLQDKYDELQTSYRSLMEVVTGIDAKMDKVKASEEAARSALQLTIEGVRVQSEENDKLVLEAQQERDILRDLLTKTEEALKSKCHEIERLRSLTNSKHHEMSEQGASEKTYWEKKYMQAVQDAEFSKNEADAQYMELASRLEAKEKQCESQLQQLSDVNQTTEVKHSKDTNLEFQSFLVELQGLLLIEENVSDLSVYLKTIKALILAVDDDSKDIDLRSVDLVPESYNSDQEGHGSEKESSSNKRHVESLHQQLFESQMKLTEEKSKSTNFQSVIEEQNEVIKSLRHQFSQLSEKYVKSVGSIFKQFGHVDGPYETNSSDISTRGQDINMDRVVSALKQSGISLDGEFVSSSPEPAYAQSFSSTTASDAFESDFKQEHQQIQDGFLHRGEQAARPRSTLNSRRPLMESHLDATLHRASSSADKKTNERNHSPFQSLVSRKPRPSEAWSIPVQNPPSRKPTTGSNTTLPPYHSKTGSATKKATIHVNNQQLSAQGRPSAWK